MELLKQYRKSQQGGDGDEHNIQPVHQTDVMKTVQNVIAEIQRKYELAAATASNAQETAQNKINQHRDVGMDMEIEGFDKSIETTNAEIIVPITSQPIDGHTKSDQQRVSRSENRQSQEGDTSELSTVTGASKAGEDTNLTEMAHEPTASEGHHANNSTQELDAGNRSEGVDEMYHIDGKDGPSTSHGRDESNLTEEGNGQITSEGQPRKILKKIRKRVERFREHNIAIKSFPHPEHATEQQVEELRLKYDFPSFPKLKDMGPGSIFTEEEESEMKIYLSDVCVLGIPRTSEEFKEDATVYYNIKRKEDPTLKKHTFFNSITLIQINLIMLEDF